MLFSFQKLWWINIIFVGFMRSDCPSPPPWIRPWFCVSFTAPWWWNGSFQTPQRFQLLNRSLFRSSPVVMNLKWRRKECWQKNRRQRWDICKESTVWHFVARSTGLKSVKPGMSSHFSDWREPSCVSAAMYIQNVPGKNSELSPWATVYTNGKRPRWRDVSPTLLGPVLVWK